MARILMAGAETADLSEVSAHGGNGARGVAAGARSNGLGSYVYTYFHTSTFLQFNLPYSVNEAFVRAWILMSPSTHTQDVVQLKNPNGQTIVSLFNTASAKLELRRGGTSNVANIDLAWGETWRMLEMHLVIDTSTLQVTVKIDGTTYAEYSGAPPALTTYSFAAFTVLSLPNYTFRLDDLAINDTTGTENNSWCGDGSIVAMRPSGNGASSQWVDKNGSQANNWQAVDDASPDNDTTYVYTDAPDKEDNYLLSDLAVPAEYTVKAVKPFFRARTLTAGGDTVQVGLKDGENEVWETEVQLTPNYVTYPLSIHNFAPDGSPWSVAKANALTLSIKSGLAP